MRSYRLFRICKDILPCGAAFNIAYVMHYSTYIPILSAEYGLEYVLQSNG